MTSLRIFSRAQRLYVILTETHRGIETHSGYILPGGYQTATRLGSRVPLGHGISHDGGWHVIYLDPQLSDAVRE